MTENTEHEELTHEELLLINKHKYVQRQSFLYSIYFLVANIFLVIIMTSEYGPTDKLPYGYVIYTIAVCFSSVFAIFWPNPQIAKAIWNKKIKQ